MSQQPLRIHWKDNLLRCQLIQKFESANLIDELQKSMEPKFNVVKKVENLLVSDVGVGTLQVGVEDFADLTRVTSVITFKAGSSLTNLFDEGKRLLDRISTLLPQQAEPLTTFDIFMPISGNERDGYEKAEDWSTQLSKQKIGIGTVRGCIFSILEPEEKERYHRYYFLSPIKSQKYTRNFDDALIEIVKIAGCSAQLSKLEKNSINYFISFKPGETEISERIDAFQWDLLKPDPVKMETLGSWLGYIMEREASLSAMISTMRSNRIEAASFISQIETSFRRLNEISLPGHPTSSESEIIRYNDFTRKYDDFITGSEALKARLGTVMENVRTYLTMQQQKLTLDEQKSSREQLVRLVSLQEIFHKIEIFILAVYMTEMARIIFDVVVNGESALYTAIFVPIALVLAIFFSRLLHGKSKE